MKIKIRKDLIVGITQDKNLHFKEGQIVDLQDGLANDLLIMQVAERYFEQPSIKIAHRKHLAKIGLK